ncbi:helix-turn-helix domain-containing protein [Streptosporangium lutulentum]
MTQQDRQRIAAGLTDGLSYAEIARRLDRPTSTITREITRNGGPAATGPSRHTRRRSSELGAARRHPRARTHRRTAWRKRNSSKGRSERGCRR